MLGVVDRALSAQFRRLGAHIGRKPGYYIVLPVVISLLAATGVQQLRYESDIEYLFSPVNGRSKTEKATVERLFPTNFTEFDPGRSANTGYYIRLIVTKPGGGSLLTQEVFAELAELDRVVRDVKVDAGTEQWTYDQICAMWEGKCRENVALKMGEFITDVEAGKSKVTYPLWYVDDTCCPSSRRWGRRFWMGRT